MTKIEPTLSCAFSAMGNIVPASLSNSGASSVTSSQSIPSTSISSSSSQSSLSRDLGGLTDFYGNEFEKDTTPCPPFEKKGHCIEPEDESVSGHASGLKQPEKRWFCVFDEHKGKSFGKRADWKKHMSDFHEPGKKTWQCPDCQQMFDQLVNFRQHHRMQHCRRSPCKHTSSTKKLAQTKQVFACGCRSCEYLLSSWDEWRDHVVQHLENGMTPNQWQYNTLFRNLLRRPDIHARWKAYVSEKVGHYNISPRFNWRPRNTLFLRNKLEYNEIILNSDAGRLVEDAYQTGLEVRSAHELLDPSTLIVEPSRMSSQLLIDSNGHSQHQDSYPNAFSGSGSYSENLPFGSYHQDLDQQGFQPAPERLPPAPNSAMSEIGNQVDSGKPLDIRQHPSSLPTLDTGNWWDYGFTLDNNHNAISNFTTL
jgi:hypothetical protein